MAHQNRIDPCGDFHAVPQRGTLMGNRGILHDEKQRICRSHRHQNWVTCRLDFKDRKRTVMALGRYTELFFLDEATAFAAGHRPCAECRRARYREFTEAWLRAHGAPSSPRPLPQLIDRTLHAARITRSGEKPVFKADVESLSNGTIFRSGHEILLLWDRRQWRWSFNGYRAQPQPTTGPVTVLTPQPLLAVFEQGFTPRVHPSAM
ncbi:hypothetical protein [Pararhodobacter oceanensis]|uniref:hypothetical protein n=1 Tax=Pararhodobacter oceanensis TaxID=2172121 RepID=UPI003A94DF96